MEDNWIRIEIGKLPPINTEVILGHDKDKWVVIGYREPKHQGEIKYWNWNEHSTTGDCEIYPTHWMEKPKPPKT